MRSYFGGTFILVGKGIKLSGDPNGTPRRLPNINIKTQISNMTANRKS